MTTRRCPACRTDTPAADFLAGLCLACFSAGKPIPLGPLDTPADEARQIRNHRQRQGIWTEAERVTERDTVQRGATKEDVMALKPDRAEMATCDVCGKEVKRQGLGVHKARAHKDGNDGDPGSLVVCRAPSIPQARRPPETDCAFCPLRGNHAEQDLFTQFVRGGLSVPDAVARMAQARAVYGRSERASRIP